MEARHAAHPSLDGLLTEAGRLLAASLDLDDTLRTVARLAVPELADWAAVDVLQADGSLRQLSSGHADPAKDALLLELRERHRLRPGAPADREGATRVITQRRPAIFPPAPVDALPFASTAEIRLWEQLAPVSFLVVPMEADGVPLGALTLLSTDPDRVYVEDDFPVALELAERCAQALRNAQAYAAAESSRALLDALIDTAPVGMAFVDTDLRFVFSNRAFADVLEATGEETTRLARQVLADGQPVRHLEIRGDDGRTFLASYAPVAGERSTVGVVCAIVDLTERRAAERERERLLDRAARLQAVTEQLSAALTKDEVAEVIVQAGMAATGASCGVLGLRHEDRALRIEHRFGMAGGAPSDLPLDLEAPMPRAARDAAPVLLDSRDAWLQRFPDLPPRGDFEAFAAVPLLFEGRVPGCMGLGFPQRGPFDVADVDLLVAIARQGAQALERARLYEERAYVARTLQAGLLPRALPDIPGLEVAVRYRPVGDGSEVGGDFYDLFGVGEESWLVAIGDVCGKGAQSAVLSGIVRSTIRALALAAPGAAVVPAAVLEGVNAALLREGDPAALATAACGLVRPGGEAGAFTIALSAGGHPPPLLRRAEGDVEEVEVPGRMLGVAATADPGSVDVELRPGDLLLLYTDGVLDARTGRETFGEERLRATLAATHGLPAADALRHIDAAVRAFAPGPVRDDKALMALRVPS